MTDGASADPMARQMEVFATLVPRQPTPRRDQPGATSHYELTYASPLGFRPLSLDLHVPDGDGPFPVLVWVHGGGWLGGLRANAGTYHLNAHRIAGWGASAGAHLVSMVALTADDPELEGDVGGNAEQSSALQAVVDYFVVSDLAALDRDPMTARPMPGATRTMQESLMGFAPAARPAEALRASPLGRVHQNAPPFLLLHGDPDPLVPPKHSQDLYQALPEVRVASRLVLVGGAVHEDPQFWQTDALETVQSFLASTL